VATVPPRFAGAAIIEHRGHHSHLVRGINPLGWTADAMYVPDRENQ